MTRTAIINNLLLAVSLCTLAVGCSHSKASGAGTGAITLAIHPPAVTIAPGQIIPFAASVTGASDTAVIWSVLEGAAGGQVSVQGVYTAPATGGAYHVVAASHADTSKTATAVVTVTGAAIADGGGDGTPDGGTAATTTHVTRDPNGWTVVTPSIDSRIIYVSSSQGNDANNGLSDATPLKTLGAAVKLLRSGYPDWLLLKAGDVWVGGGFGTFTDIGGRSTDEPMLFSSYGSGARPQLQPNGTEGALFAKQGTKVCPHVYVIGLDFYDPRLDPSSSSFQTGPLKSVTGFGWLDGGDDILVEDCYFRFLNGGIDLQPVSGPNPQNVVLRRNVVTDIYVNPGDCQGFFFYKVTNLLVEENVFDHNGWNDQAGVPADVFSHHLYIDEVNNMVFRRNLVLRSSSLSVKFRSDDKDGSIGAVVQNNFLFEGEVGISVRVNGGTILPSDGTCFSNYQILDNVLLQINRDNPTGRGIGWGMEILSTANSVISGNVFSDFSFTGNAFAISLTGDDDTFISTGITVQNNLAYRIHDEALEFDLSRNGRT